MKISIWQQFSSNHSAGFDIVGEFVSVEKAQEVYQTLHEILTLIKEFRRGHDEAIYGLTWPEQELSKQYNVEWKTSIDWLFPDDESINKHLILHEKFVAVTNADNQCYEGGYPIAEIVKKLSDKTYTEFENRVNCIEVQFDCILVDDAQRATLMKELTDFILIVNKESAETPDPPWREFSKPVTTNGVINYLDDLFYGQLSENGNCL